MKNIALIPARGGSKGIKRKNIKLFNNMPLIYWTIKTALASDYIDRVVVSTEDEEIADISRSLCAEVPFMRPDCLAQDNSTGIETVLHALDHLSEARNILLMQPTSPLRRNNLIDKSISKIQKKRGDSLISLSRLSEPHPIKLKKIIKNKVVDFIKWNIENPPRQSLPKVYQPTGAIYIVKRNFLIKKNSLKGKKNVPFVVSNDEFVNIYPPM